MTWMGALRSVMTRKNENKKLEGTHGWPGSLGRVVMEAFRLDSTTSVVALLFRWLITNTPSVKIFIMDRIDNKGKMHPSRIESLIFKARNVYIVWLISLISDGAFLNKAVKKQTIYSLLQFVVYRWVWQDSNLRSNGQRFYFYRGMILIIVSSPPRLEAERITLALVGMRLRLPPRKKSWEKNQPKERSAKTDPAMTPARRPLNRQNKSPIINGTRRIIQLNKASPMEIFE
jgi:hypothetical protein